MRTGNNHSFLIPRMSDQRVCSWGIVFCGLLLIFAPLPLTAKPIVTIIDDDARSEKAIASVKTVADRCGIKVTFAAIAAHLERNPELVSLLQEYVGEGHEIASHSLTHSPKVWKADNAIDVRAIEQEMIESEAVFKRLELQPKTFVYPYGSFPKEVRHVIFQVVGRYYPVAFNARGDMNLPGKMYPLYVSRHPLRKHNSLFMMKRLIDDAVASGDSWVVILTHSANSDFSAEMLESIIVYAQKSGAVILPAFAAWQEIDSWPMMNEDDIPDYSRLGDYLNAAYFHLPLLAGGGLILVLLCGGVLYLVIRRLRTKATTQVQRC